MPRMRIFLTAAILTASAFATRPAIAGDRAPGAESNLSSRVASIVVSVKARAASPSLAVDAMLERRVASELAALGRDALSPMFRTLVSGRVRSSEGGKWRRLTGKQRRVLAAAFARFDESDVERLLRSVSQRCLPP